VGQRSKFNSEGVVPVNATRANIINSGIENDWRYLPFIKALVAVSALLHDWGKASQLFQNKLDPKIKTPFKGDPIRHEWISCLLLNAVVRINSGEKKSDDQGWLSALASSDINEEKISQIGSGKYQRPLSTLPPIAKLLSWLIVSHHRLPLLSNSSLKAESAKGIDDVLILIAKGWGYENKYDEADYLSRLDQCFIFPKGLLSQSEKWLKELKKWSQRLLDCQPLAQQALADGSYRVVLHHARLCLMLGDHYYSSQPAAKRWQDNIGLFANTERSNNTLKQKLDEHLVGVARQGIQNAHWLPKFETGLPYAEGINALKKLSPKDYRWQDKAVDGIKVYLNSHQEKQGFFIVNMASTGCGKTFANAKIMRALSHNGDSLRFVLALGLRPLTLQTGDEYRQRVGLDDSELAVLIGSRAVMELNQQAALDKEKESYENSGSLSEEKLLDEEVHYDCDIPVEGLATALTTERDRKFLYAPVLACTIDHLMAATETKRGGRYILPSLRLMSSDLVIDEVDDFTGDDLIAIGRLVHLAGMLGRKVMISSATIPPDLAEGYFKAYRDGWLLYSQTREVSTKVGCAWVDEFSTQVLASTDVEVKDAVLAYREQHTQFIECRVAKLSQQPIKRKAIIAQCDAIFNEYQSNHNDELVILGKQQTYFDIVLQNAIELHQHHHAIDQKTQLAVSFGVIRVANIQPCVALTQHLLSAECPSDTEIRVMAYHSQQILLMRHEQEQHLDAVLKRKEKIGEQPQAFSNTIVRSHLDKLKCSDSSIKQVLFILVATPVEEVGRDHDFDWAVIEPSSYRSIIQLAGRVRRHRQSEAKKTNIHILQYNWRGIKYQHIDNNQAFQKPGFEEKGMRLESHDLCHLVNESAINKRLDAIPRIQKSEPLRHNTQLADLEHYVTKELVATYRSKTVNGKSPHVGPATLQGYLREPWFLTALPPLFTPFRAGQPNIKIFLVIDDENSEPVFCEKNEQGAAIPREEVLGINRLVLGDEESQRLWLLRDYEQSIERIAEQQEVGRRRISLRYGELSFPFKDGRKYEYSDQLGLVRVERSP